MESIDTASNGTSSVLTCDLAGNAKEIKISVKNLDGRLLTEVGFQSKSRSTEVGFEIIKAGLVAWIIGEFRDAMAICLHFDLDPRTVAFVERLNNDVIGQLANSSGPTLITPKVRNIEPSSHYTVSTNALIGNSGGRDSSMSSFILRESGFKLHPYKISYDKPSKDAVYSTSQRGGNKDLYHEPFDIPVTYFAPFWEVGDSVPEFVSVGHSFDVLGFESVRRTAPYESPVSMQTHQDYLQEMLGTKVKFAFPLATLSTYSIFELARRMFGLSAVESKVSCWNSTENDCGHCDKCQRIKLASASIHTTNYEYLSDTPQVVEDHSFLLGNAGYNELVEQHGVDSIAERQLFSRGLPFIDLIADHLNKKLSGKYIDTHIPSSVRQPTCANTDPDITARRIGIDYRDLPFEKVNDCDGTLPFERNFDRNTNVLSAHGEHPRFDGSKWSNIRVSEGPRLEVPDTPLFRKFFNQ